MEPSSSSRSIKSEDVFEINDFTVVTEFEVFVLSLENSIQEMRTEVDNFEEKSSTIALKALSERTIEYESYHFQLEYFRQKRGEDEAGSAFVDEELIADDKMDIEEENEEEADASYLCKAASNFMNTQDDFLEQSIVAKQYGIATDFILIQAIGKNNYFSESMVNMVQSAVNVATSNIECELPILFQFTAGAAVGVMQNRNSITNFEGVVLNRCLGKHRFLDGVIEMFKEKLNVPPGGENKIKISLQMDYQKCLESPQQQLDHAAASMADTPAGLKPNPPKSCTHKYHFQAVDPTLLKELCLGALWVDVPEHLLAESEHFSNIDPQRAHKWKLGVRFDGEFSYEFSYLFTRLLDHREEDYSTGSVKSQIPMPSTSEHGGQHSLAASALGPLLDKPAIQFELVPRLDFLEDEDFSHESISACFSTIMVNVAPEEDEAGPGEHPEVEHLLHKLALAKSAPSNCLTTRLATCLMSRVDANLAGFCRLWLKFLDLLRHHWEYNLSLPGLPEEDRPDLAHCLLHQKLQMVQHCIGVKRRKHVEMDTRQKGKGGRGVGGGQDAGISTSKGQNDAGSSTGKSGGVHGVQDDMESSINDFITAPEPLTEEEDFYDAMEDVLDAEASSSRPLDTPKGRSHPLEPEEFLRDRPEERIFVPLTQDQGPMTEDQLDRHETYLASLQGSLLRNKAQSDLLLSDMRAFKAANPGCVLEDFLRWHSPRDLVDGQLSERMNVPGNLWQESWEMAKPMAAARQTRLFNETKEVEQIFQFFTNLKLKQLIDLLLPVVSTQMAAVLIRNSSNCMDWVKPRLDKLVGQVQYITRSMDEDVEAIYELGTSMRSIEAFLMKFSTVRDLLEEQASKANVQLELDGPRLGQFLATICQVQPDAVDELSLRSPQQDILVPDDGQLLELVRSFMAEEEGTEQDMAWAKEPSRKQVICRRVVPHPGQGSRPMPQRMYTSYRPGEFLLCGTFSSDVTLI